MVDLLILLQHGSKRLFDFFLQEELTFLFESVRLHVFLVGIPESGTEPFGSFLNPFSEFGIHPVSKLTLNVDLFIFFLFRAVFRFIPTVEIGEFQLVEQLRRNSIEVVRVGEIPIVAESRKIRRAFREDCGGIQEAPGNISIRELSSKSKMLVLPGWLEKLDSSGIYCLDYCLDEILKKFVVDIALDNLVVA